MVGKGETDMRKILFLGLFALTLVFLSPGLVQKAHAAEASRAGTVVTAQTRLNVRAAPSTSSTILAGLPRNGIVTLISQSGNWWKVEYAAGRYGYCHKDYIAPLPTQTATVSADGSRLNIRTGPSTGYRVTSQYRDGASVIVLSSSGGWARVLYEGTKTGYVSEAYLRTHSSGKGAVTLSVPRYSQTDSRWADVRLGNSPYTIRTAGCTTTAMAMVESTVRGTTVTPGALAREVRYSSSGDLYWPSHYSAYTGRDYLSEVYRQLQAGRPVMIGGYTPSGAQHWAVITGFTGGELTASNFTIHDPGTSSRRTLADFQAKYSVFYKIMIRR